MLRSSYTLRIPLAIAFSCVPYGSAQSTTAPKDFEVVSIKAADPNVRMVQMELAPGGRFTATGVTLRLLLQRCYSVRDFQISGAPSWAGSDRYQINAKAEDGQRNIGPEQISLMLRGVLTERFQLTFHRETKEGSVYFLVPGKGGPKLKEAEGGGDGRQDQQVRMGRGMIDSKGASIEALVNQLSNQLGRPVIDKTGLTGLYDFKLEWTPDAETAFDLTLALNDKYEMDGRDPNGYAGVAWAIGGKHDRAWGERPIFGTIRFMSGASTGRKFDSRAYIANVARLRR